MISHYDVAVVGAGPAGAVAALVLAQAGRKVLLFDRQDFGRKKVGECLPPAARPLLKHLGLSAVLDSGAHLISHGNCSAWGSEELSFTDFIRDPNGAGWHLDRLQFDRDLCAAAEDCGVKVIRGHIDHLENVDELWSWQNDGDRISFKTVIDATGRSATLAKIFGAKILRDDSLMAVCAWGKNISNDDTDGRTLIEAVEDGWWYTALLPDKTRLFTFHTDAEQVGKLDQLPQLWRDQLAKTLHVKKYFKNETDILDFACRPAGGARLDSFYGPRWLATGDAALAFDPLSSQGLFNALYTGMKAAQGINEYLSGNTAAFLAYGQRLEQIRRAYQAHYSLYYAQERRWSQRPFWKKRLANGSRFSPALEPASY